MQTLKKIGLVLLGIATVGLFFIVAHKVASKKTEKSSRFD
jgi:hypothetical protein